MLRSSTSIVAGLFTTACGGDDSGSSNAGADAGPNGATDCDPAGMYDIVWTPGAGNAEDCPALDSEGFALIMPDGFDSPDPCGHSACTPSTCVREPVGAECMASFTVIGPCLDFDEGRVLNGTSDYDGDEALFTIMDSEGPCSYSGVGTKR